MISHHFKSLSRNQQTDVLKQLDTAAEAVITREWIRDGLVALRHGFGKDGRKRFRIGKVITEIKSAIKLSCGSDMLALADLDETTLSRWLDKDTQNPSRVPFGLLLFFLLIGSEDNVLPPNAQRIVRRHQQTGGDRIQALIDIVRTVPSDTLPPRSPTAIPETEVFESLLRLSLDTRMLHNHDFLRKPEPWPRSDETYYIVYRHSTDRGAIVKTLLIVQTPLKASTGNWSFQHFLKGGKEFNSGIARISEGILLALHPSYYLLGFTYNVDSVATDLTDSAERAPYRRDVRGLEIIAIEEADIKNSKDLFPALIQTQAAMSQPVAARIAALCIGSLSTIGKAVTHQHVLPAEIYDKHLEKDIQETAISLGKAGIRLSGSVLDFHSGDAAEVEVKAKQLTSRIRKLIDNTPAWEASMANLDRLKEPKARGALETYSDQGRPRP